jgi:DNA-binding response OmpR family regulator
VGVRLLLIDDDVKLATAVARGLGAEGFSVDVCHDGGEGLWRASEVQYDLIVLDLMLPGRNGFQVCAELRQRGNWTPILMLTAKDGDLDEAEGLDTGADDYLTKPFSFAVLVARVRALLRRAGAGGGEVLTLGDLRLDQRRRRVHVGETEVTLTTREFELLACLMARPDQVLSKQQLIDAVWDIAFDGDPNIVEVYIGRLRRKLDEPFGRASIRTVRGAGYRLVPGP